MKTIRVLMLTVLTLIVQGMALIAFIFFFDGMNLEDEFSSDQVEPETEIHEYGTHIKSSRGKISDFYILN